MSPEQPHVVVVNDNPEFLRLMAELLEDERYPSTVIDGDRPDAVALICAAVPDVLIIELRLGDGEFHGWSVLQEVRRDPHLRTLPTLICTGDLRALHQIEAQLATFPRVDVLTKPFAIDDLFAKLAGLLADEVA